MRYRIKYDTDWHDGEFVITVPAGELVQNVDIKAVPEDQGRRDIAEGIAKYKRQGREFVPVAIRDWFALVDKTWLQLVTTGPVPHLKKMEKNQPALPGLRAPELAPCATE